MEDKKKILIVDDEADFAEMMKWNLEETGKYEVVIETKGKQALSTAKNVKPDLIILDIIMPDIGGEDVEGLLKADKELKSIPIIFLTAIVKEGDMPSKTHGKRRRIFLSKPVSFDKLTDCIDKNIQKRK